MLFDDIACSLPYRWCHLASSIIPKLSMVIAIMKVAENIVEGVRFIIPTLACSVLVEVWH
jgi:hypothetical protein